MEDINSVSKGVFTFKKGKSIRELRNKTAKPFVTSFNQAWKDVEQRIEQIQSSSYEKISTSLLDYIGSIDFEDNENLQTAVLLTGVNQTDHLSQFETLSQQISNNCQSQVAILQSRDCPNVKAAIETLVKGFMNQGDGPQVKRRQLTMEVMAAWYKHRYAASKVKPMLVIMIADFEQFNSVCMQDLISILCCYTTRIPFVLIVGVATAFKALHNVLPSHITNKMDVNIFQSESSTVVLNRILDEVILSHQSPFQLSGKSFQILMDVFLFYDFSLQRFIKGYKQFMFEHYRNCPFNPMFGDYNMKTYELDEDSCDEIRRNFDSFRSYVEAEPAPQVRIDLIQSNDTMKLRIIKELDKARRYLFQFHCGLRVLAVLLEDLPKNELGTLLRELYPVCISTDVTKNEDFEKCFNLLRFTAKEKFIAKLDRVLEILRRYLSDKSIKESGFKNDLDELQMYYKRISDSGLETVKTVATPTQKISPAAKGFAGRQALFEELKRNAQNNPTHQLLEYEQRLYECLDFLKTFISRNLRPIKAAPAFNEFYFFSDYNSVREQIIGAPRGVLHNALNNPQRILQCSCCVQAEHDQIIPTCPDTSIGYKLHLESNKFINLYDWLLAFATVNGMDEDDDEISTEIQARFYRLVAELQFLGFIKQAKQKTDHVVRLTW